MWRRNSAFSDGFFSNSPGFLWWSGFLSSKLYSSTCYKGLPTKKIAIISWKWEKFVFHVSCKITPMTSCGISRFSIVMDPVIHKVHQVGQYCHEMFRDHLICSIIFIIGLLLVFQNLPIFFEFLFSATNNRWWQSKKGLWRLTFRLPEKCLL